MKAYNLLADRTRGFGWNFDDPLQASDWKAFNRDSFRISGSAIQVSASATNPHPTNEVLSRVKNCFRRFVVDVDFRVNVGTKIPTAPAAKPRNASFFDRRNSFPESGQVPLTVFLHAGYDATRGIKTGYALELGFWARKSVWFEGDRLHYDHSLRVVPRVLRYDLSGREVLPCSLDPGVPFFLHEVRYNEFSSSFKEFHQSDFPFAPQGRNSVKFLSDGQRTVVKLNGFKLCEFANGNDLYGSLGFGNGVGLKMDDTASSFTYLPPFAVERLAVRRLRSGEPID